MTNEEKALVDRGQPARALTLRAVVSGLLGLSLICGLVSYNDYTLKNTPLIGNYLPIGVVLLTFLFVVFVNGPLSRFAPRWAFSGGELCVMFSVILVGCSVPASGLVRYLVPSWVMPVALGRQYPEFADLFLKMGLPDWMFPVFRSSDRSTWFTDPIVTGYETRWNADGGIPYGAFVRPFLTWGVFVFAFFGGLLSMVLVVRRQWVENERLPFPLAQIQMALIAPPERGKWLNETLSNKLFWLAFGAVFLLHGYNGLMLYFKQDAATITTGFDLQKLFTEPPFNYVEASFFKSNLFFTAAAVTFFLNRAVGFSLWFFYIFQQMTRVWLGEATGDPNIPGQADVHFGGLMAFAMMILWAGRKHYKSVLGEALYLSPRDRSEHMYGSPAMAARVLLGCMAVMVGWLWMAGATVPGAVVMVLLLFILFLTLTRFVAEVGLIHAQHQVPVQRPFSFLDQIGLGKLVPIKTYYLGTQLQGIYFDARETLPVYASHSLKLADDALEGTRRGERLRLVWLFVFVLGFSYTLSVFFHLRNEYTYAATLDGTNAFPIDNWGGRGCWEWMTVNPTLSYHRSSTMVAHNPLGWFAGGFVAVTALYAGRLMFPGWPLHPIGLLMVGSYPMSTLWFSFFVGWVAKVIVVRFGGTELYTRAKPMAIGLIVGEALAAAMWMATAVVLVQMKLPITPVRILPP